MSTRLQEAFAEAAKLPEVDQDAFAEFLLAELQDESEWQSQFSRSPSTLERLAAQARTERTAGQLEPIEDLFQ